MQKCTAGANTGQNGATFADERDILRALIENGFLTSQHSNGREFQIEGP